MLTEAIKEKINDLFNNTSESVSVGYGKKITNNKYTGEVGIIFYVERKFSLHQLPEDEVLPSSVTIDSVEYVTDVVAVGSLSPLSCDSGCYTWRTIPPLNRDTSRPIKGGLAMNTQNTQEYVGTLGFIAVDIATQALVGVTNNHVTNDDNFYTSYRNTVDGVILNEMNDQATQNAGNYPSIGKVVRYKPFSETGNTIDCSLISVKPEVISLTESFKQYGLSYNLPMAFATTAELDNLLTTDPPIYSSGRTTGAKGPGPCQLTIAGIGVQVTVPYKNQFYTKNAGFVNCILFTRPDPTCEDPIAGGDSGSALIADFNGVWKIIGLVFAGGTATEAGVTYYIGVGCRIDEVANIMQIQAWDGTAKNYIDTNSFQYITVAGGSSDLTKTCNASTYWQVGLTADTYSC